VLHPALMLIAGGLLLPFLRGSARNIAVLSAPTFALAALWLLPEGKLWQLQWLDYTLAPLVVDKLSRLFATIFLLMAAVGGLFALGQTSRLEVPAAFLYAGSAVGVTLAGDLITVFLFWELMAVGSTLVLWSAATPGAGAASRRYVGDPSGRRRGAVRRHHRPSSPDR
jgi:multicomponent Na+:H+ antiporter subunit D